MTTTSGEHGVLDGPVLVIGSGLIGASVALSLRRAGVDVLLADVDADNLAVAVDAGAGRPVSSGDEPTLVVAAVPPRHAPHVLAEASARYPAATLTDVTSVKIGVISAALDLGADPVRLVGGHPMAGREVSGAAGARADLLDDRLWVLTPLPANGVAHVRQVHRLVSACGAYPVELGLDEHDAAEALVSHAPQVLSSVLAGRLVDADPARVRIAGQVLRDMTRIAGSNVSLWTDILSANAGQVADVIDAIVSDLSATSAALRQVEAEGGEPVAGVERMLATGVAGQERIPGKHGAAPAPTREITVMLADRPGQLAALFTAIGEASINLEDVRIEHVLGRPSGLVGLTVRPDHGDLLIAALTERDFDVRA